MTASQGTYFTLFYLFIFKVWLILIAFEREGREWRQRRKETRCKRERSMGGPCKRPELGTELATSECTLPGIKSVTFGFGGQRLSN